LGPREKDRSPFGGAEASEKKASLFFQRFSKNEGLGSEITQGGGKTNFLRIGGTSSSPIEKRGKGDACPAASKGDKKNFGRKGRSGEKIHSEATERTAY